MTMSTLKWVGKCHLTVCPEEDRKGILVNALHDFLTGTASVLEDNSERDTVFLLHELMVKCKRQTEEADTRSVVIQGAQHQERDLPGTRRGRVIQDLTSRRSDPLGLFDDGQGNSFF